MAKEQVAMVVGAGPGLGHALVRRFAAAGMRAAAVSRKGVAPQADGGIGAVRGFACDATIGSQVNALFREVAAQLGTPDLVVLNVGTWDRAGILDIFSHH